MRRYLIAFAMGASLIVPAVVKADDHPKRYYDKDGKDWHEWNADEDRAYRRYLEENHRAYHDWARASKKEQAEYWHWRHEHHD